MQNPRITAYSLFLLGFTSISAQVIFLREFLVSFSGNELTIGIILSAWLLLTALGSLLTGKFTGGKTNIERPLFYLQFCSVILLPVMFAIARLSKHLVQFYVTEAIGLPVIVLITTAALLPLCFVFGSWFVLCASVKPGSAYFIELLGSVAGGVTASLALVRLLGNYDIILLLSAVNGLLLLFSIGSYNLNGRKRLTGYAVLLLALIAATAGFFTKYPDKYTLEKQWEPFLVVDNKNSAYGNISVIKLENEYSFYENGMRIFSTGDEQYNEELVGLCLLSSRSTAKILILGGGLGNILQVLKFKVEKVTYVGIDPAVIEIEKKYYSGNNALSDSRLTIIPVDGRLFVDRNRGKYDCIIIDMSDPSTGFINRFYTSEFYLNLKKLMDENSTALFSLSSTDNYMTGDLKQLSASVYKTAGSVFGNILIIPGLKNYFLLLPDKMEINPSIITGNLRKERIKNKYFDRNYINYYFRSERIEKVRKWLSEVTEPEINRDLHPVCYFYSFVYWLSNTGGNLKKTLWQKPLFVFPAAIVLLIIVFFALKGAGKTGNMTPLVLMILTASFYGISFEMLLILTYQSLYGYLYNEIGLLIAFSMAGIASGNRIYVKYLSRFNRRRVLLSINLFLFLYALLSPVIITCLPKPFIYLLTVFSGFPAGIMFAMLSVSLLGASLPSAETAGVTYFFDLLGAVAGTLLTSLYLIPVIGIIKTYFLLSVPAFVLILYFLLTGEKSF